MVHSKDPLTAFLDGPDDAVLAIVAGVEGPSYRPVGAMMAVLGPHDRVGNLSSGCVESDIVLHAVEARDSSDPKLVRYGRNSPYIDIQLPCGGGLDIALLPNPDRALLHEINAKRMQRVPCAIDIDLATGTITESSATQTSRDGNRLSLFFAPTIQFLTFGKGPEASTFAGLVQACHYPNTLFSPDAETRQEAEALGCDTVQLTTQRFPDDIQVDDRTAIVLFFHDHDWEPPLLEGALETSAFYIGAQGSRRARDARLATLSAMGLEEAVLSRLVGPVGLIESARDPNTLAVSVLAEVLQRAGQQG